ncbi:MAG: hypothetical protein H6573_33370 [Lewinellaceae bacterium]|nr:hypothetical protein [Lewinellaceae bacterium]
MAILQSLYAEKASIYAFFSFFRSASGSLARRGCARAAGQGCRTLRSSKKNASPFPPLWNLSYSTGTEKRGIPYAYSYCKKVKTSTFAKATADEEI